MKRWWKQLETRIDAFSLRERVLLFVSLLVVVLLLGHTLWLEPALSRYTDIAKRFASQNTELLKLHDELKNSGGETGPGRAMRQELVQIREQLAAVNHDIAQMPMSASNETPLTQVLVHFLRRHEGLVLVRTATLAVDPRQGLAGSEANLGRQGLELTVAGPYSELVRYVQTLERAMPALRWGTMKLNSEQRPTELNIQVWLLGTAS